MLAKMDCYGLTDPGLKRPTNQDHYLIADLNKSMRVNDTSLNLDSQTRVYGGSSQMEWAAKQKANEPAPSQWIR